MTLAEQSEGGAWQRQGPPLCLIISLASALYSGVLVTSWLLFPTICLGLSCVFTFSSSSALSSCAVLTSVIASLPEHILLWLLKASLFPGLTTHSSQAFLQHPAFSPVTLLPLSVHFFSSSHYLWHRRDSNLQWHQV